MAIVPDEMLTQVWSARQPLSPTPTIAVNAHAGSTATATIAGTNAVGKIVIASAGTGQAAGVQASVTFGLTFNKIPLVFLVPADATSEGITPMASNPSTTGFDVDAVLAMTASSTYTYYYFVVSLDN